MSGTEGMLRCQFQWNKDHWIPAYCKRQGGMFAVRILWDDLPLEDQRRIKPMAYLDTYAYLQDVSIETPEVFIDPNLEDA